MEVQIPFQEDWCSIAVSVSGGADSALLAYLLCKKIPTDRDDFQVHVISHIRCWKTKPWQVDDALRVYYWLENHFPHVKFKRHVNFIAPELEYGTIGPTLTDEYGKRVSGDNIEQRAFAEYVCWAENCDAYYNGVTRNPRDIDLGGMIERDIDPSEDNRHLEIMLHMGRLACHPFRFIDKSWVVAQYRTHNILDLFELTRSCEGEFADIDYTNYTPGQTVPTCGKCFWCREREWAVNV